MIIGKPGSGKTNLLKFILTSNQLLFKKFDYVYVISPSPKEYDEWFLPDGNINDEFDFEWIDTKINALKKSKQYINVLFVFDDVVVDMKNESLNKKLLQLVFNRRHKLDNVSFYYCIQIIYCIQILVFKLLYSNSCIVLYCIVLKLL